MTRNSLIEASTLPEVRNIELIEAPAPLDGNLLSRELDDRTTDYVLRTKGAFDALRRASAQLAGVLILAAAAGRPTDPGDAILALTREAIAEAEDRLRGCQPTPRARHHHHHLMTALARLRDAVGVASRPHHGFADHQTRDALDRLRAGWQEMQWAGTALPGFEVVAFDQACCAMHAPPPRR